MSFLASYNQKLLSQPIQKKMRATRVQGIYEPPRYKRFFHSMAQENNVERNMAIGSKKNKGPDRAVMISLINGWFGIRKMAIEARKIKENIMKKWTMYTGYKEINSSKIDGNFSGMKRKKHSEEEEKSSRAYSQGLSKLSCYVNPTSCY